MLIDPLASRKVGIAVRVIVIILCSRPRPLEWTKATRGMALPLEDGLQKPSRNDPFLLGAVDIPADWG
jgi:hypothetical protein